MEKKLGICPCCHKDVYDDHLYVYEEKTKNVYHYSCYNLMKAKEDAKD